MDLFFISTMYGQRPEPWIIPLIRRQLEAMFDGFLDPNVGPNDE
jgi:hypothetical protein